MEKDPNTPWRGGDIQCLRCRSWNIPDNHICGNCGASLPVLYDEEGHPRFSMEPRRVAARYLVQQSNTRFIKIRIFLSLILIVFIIILLMVVLGHL